MMRLSIGDRCYRVLLRAFPRAVRDAYGDEMVALFREARRRCARRPLRLCGLWMLALDDALRHGALERLDVPLSPTGTRRTTMAGDTSSRSLSSGLAKDIQWGARRLRATPGFTAIAALTLALGIGATSAIFSVVYGVLLKPLPFPDANRVVGLFQVWQGKRDVFASPNFLDVQSRAKSFSGSSAYSTHSVTLTNSGDAVRLIDAEVSAGFFDVLATPPMLGRLLERADNAPGHADVIVLGYPLWLSRFGGDRSIVGRTITIDGTARHVVGVMPRAFAWPFEAECWEPAEYTKTYTTENRGAWYLNAFGRLAAGVSLNSAAAEMATIGRDLERQYPELNAKVSMTAFPIVDDMLGDTKRALVILLAAVGFVLLIACVNVANLILARAAARDNELAVRVALGAGRWRLVRQVMVESLLLATIGGVVGLGLAWGGLRALQAVRPPGIPRLETVSLNWMVVGFAFAVTMATAVMFGLLPAFHAARRSLSDALRERGRSGAAGARGRATRQALIVTEMALAVLLLCGAGLLLRSFVRLLQVNPGFEVGQALTFRIGLPDANYKTDDVRAAFYGRTLESLRAMPGVTGVSAVSMIPPSAPQFNLTFEVKGRPPVPPADQPVLEIRMADAQYFQVMNIPVRRGRGFLPSDRVGTSPVMLITESAARRHFQNENPIGQHIKIGWHRDNGAVEGDVVGVVADVKSFGLDQEAPPQLYLPLSQIPAGSMTFIVRTAVAPESMTAASRAVVHALDGNLPLSRIETLQAHVNNTVAERRFYMLLLALFAGIALVLAGIGIFGVLSYLVAQRTREIGIRMALGARRGSLVRLIVRQAVTLALSGIALGTVCGLVATRLMKTMLFELSPTDPATFVLVDAGLFAVALLAAWVPTRRATRVDPTIALRAD